MARSGGGISRLLPHSQGEWTRCHGCPISNEPNTACTGWWRWSSRSAWTVKCNGDHLRPCNSFLTYSFFSCKNRALERDRPNQRKKKWTVKCNAACFTEWPLHQRIWRHFFGMTSSTSRSDIRWQSGPAGLFFDCGPAVPSCLGTALLGVLYVLRQSKARHWTPAITHGLYTHALWQLPEPLTLVNFFEDRQSTPERTLRWLP